MSTVPSQQEHVHQCKHRKTHGYDTYLLSFAKFMGCCSSSATRHTIAEGGRHPSNVLLRHADATGMPIYERLSDTSLDDILPCGTHRTSLQVRLPSGTQDRQHLQGRPTSAPLLNTSRAPPVTRTINTQPSLQRSAYMVQVRPQSGPLPRLPSIPSGGMSTDDLYGTLYYDVIERKEREEAAARLAKLPASALLWQPSANLQRPVEFSGRVFSRYTMPAGTSTAPQRSPPRLIRRVSFAKKIDSEATSSDDGDATPTREVVFRGIFDNMRTNYDDSLTSSDFISTYQMGYSGDSVASDDNVEMDAFPTLPDEAPADVRVVDPHATAKRRTHNTRFLQASGNDEDEEASDVDVMESVNDVDDRTYLEAEFYARSRGGKSNFSPDNAVDYMISVDQQQEAVVMEDINDAQPAVPMNDNDEDMMINDAEGGTTAEEESSDEDIYMSVLRHLGSRVNVNVIDRSSQDKYEWPLPADEDVDNDIFEDCILHMGPRVSVQVIDRTKDNASMVSSSPSEPSERSSSDSSMSLPSAFLDSEQEAVAGLPTQSLAAKSQPTPGVTSELSPLSSARAMKQAIEAAITREAQTRARQGQHEKASNEVSDSQFAPHRTGKLKATRLSDVAANKPAEPDAKPELRPTAVAATKDARLSTTRVTQVADEQRAVPVVNRALQVTPTSAKQSTAVDASHVDHLVATRVAQFSALSQPEAMAISSTAAKEVLPTRSVSTAPSLPLPATPTRDLAGTEALQGARRSRTVGRMSRRSVVDARCQPGRKQTIIDLDTANSVKYNVQTPPSRLDRETRKPETQNEPQADVRQVHAAAVVEQQEHHSSDTLPTLAQVEQSNSATISPATTSQSENKKNTPVAKSVHSVALVNDMNFINEAEPSTVVLPDASYTFDEVIQCPRGTGPEVVEADSALLVKSDVFKHLLMNIIEGRNVAMIAFTSDASLLLCARIAIAQVRNAVTLLRCVQPQKSSHVRHEFELSGSSVAFSNTTELRDLLQDGITSSGKEIPIAVGSHPILGPSILNVSETQLRNVNQVHGYMLNSVSKATSAEAVVMLLKLKQVWYDANNTPDVYLSSIFFAFLSNERKDFVNAIYERSTSFPGPLFATAVGGPSYTVFLAASIAQDSPTVRSENLELAHRFGSTVVNQPARNGRVQTFIKYTKNNLAAPHSGGTASEVIRRRMKIALRDALALCADPMGVPIKIYPISPKVRPVHAKSGTAAPQAADDSKVTTSEAQPQSTSLTTNDARAGQINEVTQQGCRPEQPGPELQETNLAEANVQQAQTMPPQSRSMLDQAQTTPPRRPTRQEEQRTLSTSGAPMAEGKTASAFEPHMTNVSERNEDANAATVPPAKSDGATHTALLTVVLIDDATYKSLLGEAADGMPSQEGQRGDTADGKAVRLLSPTNLIVHGVDKKGIVDELIYYPETHIVMKQGVTVASKLTQDMATTVRQTLNASIFSVELDSEGCPLQHQFTWQAALQALRSALLENDNVAPNMIPVEMEIFFSMIVPGKLLCDLLNENAGAASQSSEMVSNGSQSRRRSTTPPLLNTPLTLVTSPICGPHINNTNSNTVMNVKQLEETFSCALKRAQAYLYTPHSMIIMTAIIRRYHTNSVKLSSFFVASTAEVATMQAVLQQRPTYEPALFNFSLSFSNATMLLVGKAEAFASGPLSDAFDELAAALPPLNKYDGRAKRVENFVANLRRMEGRGATKSVLDVLADHVFFIAKPRTRMIPMYTLKTTTREAEAKPHDVHLTSMMAGLIRTVVVVTPTASGTNGGAGRDATAPGQGLIVTETQVGIEGHSMFTPDELLVLQTGTNMPPSRALDELVNTVMHGFSAALLTTEMQDCVFGPLILFTVVSNILDALPPRGEVFWSVSHIYAHGSCYDDKLDASRRKVSMECMFSPVFGRVVRGATIVRLDHTETKIHDILAAGTATQRMKGGLMVVQLFVKLLQPNSDVFMPSVLLTIGGEDCSAYMDALRERSSSKNLLYSAVGGVCSTVFLSCLSNEGTARVVPLLEMTRKMSRQRNGSMTPCSMMHLANFTNQRIEYVKNAITQEKNDEKKKQLMSFMHRYIKLFNDASDMIFNPTDRPPVVYDMEPNVNKEQ